MNTNIAYYLYTNFKHKCLFSAMAVTDSQLRVIGIKNIRMADASVYPRTPSGNLQGPTIMVAERAASFIWDTWNVTCSNRLTNGKFSS